MTSSELLSMYENIAGLSSQMVQAARASDWDSLNLLQDQCARAASGVAASPVPALSGAPRMRKIDLLKMIMANDRAVRDVTEPWMTQLNKVIPNAHQAS